MSLTPRRVRGPLHDAFVAAMKRTAVIRRAPGDRLAAAGDPERPAEARAIPPERRAAFEQVLRRGNLPASGLVIVPTLLYSPWFRGPPCPECHHTFRLGDPVMLCPRCRVARHQHPLHGLDCFATMHELDGRCACGHPVEGSAPAAPGRASGRDVSLFLAGLARAWDVDEAVERLVVDEDNGLHGQICAVCRHTTRLREQVVRCPCGNGPGGRCGAIIHFDLGRQLHCWKEWRQLQGRTWCPLTGLAAVEKPA